MNIIAPIQFEVVPDCNQIVIAWTNVFGVEESYPFAPLREVGGEVEVGDQFQPPAVGAGNEISNRPREGRRSLTPTITVAAVVDRVNYLGVSEMYMSDDVYLLSRDGERTPITLVGSPDVIPPRASSLEMRVTFALPTRRGRRP